LTAQCWRSTCGCSFPQHLAIRSIEVLDAKPGVVAARRIRAAQLQQHDLDGDPASRE
jgi:hypothetical protein